MDSVLAAHPAAPGSILVTPVPRFIKDCLINQWQWTVAFEQTHLVQSRGLQIQLERMPSQYNKNNLVIYFITLLVACFHLQSTMALWYWRNAPSEQYKSRGHGFDSRWMLGVSLSLYLSVTHP